MTALTEHLIRNRKLLENHHIPGKCIVALQAEAVDVVVVVVVAGKPMKRFVRKGNLAETRGTESYSTSSLGCMRFHTSCYYRDIACTHGLNSQGVIYKQT